MCCAVPTAANEGVQDGYICQDARFTTIVDPAGHFGIYLNGSNDLGAIASKFPTVYPLPDTATAMTS